MAMFKLGATRAGTSPPDDYVGAHRYPPPKAKPRPLRLFLWIAAAVCAGGLVAGVLSSCAPAEPPARMPSSTTRGAEPWGYTLMCRREPDNPLCRKTAP